MTAWNRFKLVAGLAFSSAISFFQVNSYSADKHHVNGLWVVAGVVFGLATLYELYLVIKSSNSGAKGTVGYYGNSGYSGYSGDGLNQSK